jgi:hypothetical protein
MYHHKLLATGALAGVLFLGTLTAYADSTARAGLAAANAAAQKWKPDAVLTSVSTMQADGAGKSKKWSYVFFSPKGGNAFSVDVTDQKLGDASEVPAYTKDPVGEFADSDTVMAEAKKNGVKNGGAMALTFTAQTAQPGPYWSVTSIDGPGILNVIHDAKTGRFSSKQEIK